MSKASRKSGGGAAKGPSTIEPTGEVGRDGLKGSGERSAGDPQAEHEERHEEGGPQPHMDQLNQTKAVHSSEANEAAEKEDDLMHGDQEEAILCKPTLPKTIVNGHRLEDGAVIKMSRKDIRNHRDRGVPMELVDKDYDGEVYDVSEPYVAEEEKA